MIRVWIALAVGLISTQVGCQANDPNRIAQIRYVMAYRHAQTIINQAGSALDAYDDYETLTFRRRHHDQAGVIHYYELYDFSKVSSEPGPEHFVIAYDDVTRRTHRRTDLRSNENLDYLPAFND